MATLLNDRDKALQSAPYRSKQASVTITGTASAFLVSKNTVAIVPATITLTATPSGSVYTNNAVYTWSYALSSAPTTWIQISSAANLKTQVLNNTDSWVANAFVQYRCVVTEPLLDTSYAYYTVTYTKEASDPVTVNLTRTNVLVTCDAYGTPTSFTNTDQSITVNRGNTPLAYSSNTTTPNSFNVNYVANNLTAVAGTGSGNSWNQPAITAITQDGATITYTVTVYDSANPPSATTYAKGVVYNKVSNGTIGANGADGANLYPVLNYDFAGAALPIGVTFPGTITTSDSGTTTTIQNTVVDQNLRLTNLALIPSNSYIISMRVKWITGTWEGIITYTSPTRTESPTTYYKTIPQPAQGVWTTINVDMRTLTAGGTDYMTGGNISQLRFDFINDITSQVAVDYISVGKFGVAEGTKSTTISMYAWSNSGAPAYSGAFTYTWATGTTSAYPSGWTSSAPTAPGSGYTLYQRNLVLVDAATVLTTTANWASSQVNTIGYRIDGTIGTQGDSYRIAYVVTNGAWATPTAPTAGTGDVAPSSTVTVSSLTTNWSKTATATLTDGQYMYQTDGIYSATTGNVTWGIPYLSNLKVGNLAALSATLGTVQVGNTGALYSGKTTFANNTTAGFFLGNDSGYPRFRIGNADNSSGLSFDTSTGILTLRGGSYLNSSGTTLLSATTTPADILNSALSLGGANLMKSSGNFTSTNGWSSNGSTVTYSSSVMYGNSGTLQLTGANGAYNTVIMRLKPSTQYTVSALVKGNVTLADSGFNSTLHIQTWTTEIPEATNIHQETGGAHDLAVATTWKRIYQTFTTPSSANLAYCRFYFYPLAAGLQLNIGYVKLEEGIVPTDWIANSEEAAAVTAAAAQLATNASTSANTALTQSSNAVGAANAANANATTANNAALQAQVTADGAVSTINNVVYPIIDNKLSKVSADIMTGPISFSTDSAILVGDTTNGLYLGKSGIVGKKAGATTFAVDASGNATFAGTLNVRSATSGSRIEILSDRINVYEGSTLRVRIGNLV